MDLTDDTFLVDLTDDTKQVIPCSLVQSALNPHNLNLHAMSPAVDDLPGIVKDNCHCWELVSCILEVKELQSLPHVSLMSRCNLFLNTVLKSE